MTLTDRTPVELAIAEAYRAGAEEMRERAAKVAEKHWCGDAGLYGVPAATRALPVE